MTLRLRRHQLVGGLLAAAMLVAATAATQARATTDVDDFLRILDTADDNRTQLFMESDFPALSNWRMDNNQGDLQFIEFPGGDRVTFAQDDGFVGIGTTTPAANLHVRAPSGAATLWVEGSVAARAFRVVPPSAQSPSGGVNLLKQVRNLQKSVKKLRKQVSRLKKRG